VQRSCSGEMEREVAEILGPVGVDDSLSRRVAGALTKVESELLEASCSRPSSDDQSSWWRSALRAVARTPKSTTDLEGDASKLKFEEDVGLTAFLLKFGEVRVVAEWYRCMLMLTVGWLEQGMEEVPNSRLFISAFTIATGYAVGGIIPLVSGGTWLSLPADVVAYLRPLSGPVHDCYRRASGAVVVDCLYRRRSIAVWRIQELLHGRRAGRARVSQGHAVDVGGRRSRSRGVVWHRARTRSLREWVFIYCSNLRFFVL
jgi:hypothetical protein